MNNLELNKFGVQELNERMMVDVEGGWNQNDGIMSVETIRYMQDFWTGFFSGLLA